ncbi:MAG: 50S ribosomal protein L18 [Candidatus Harrisonbacteria bacterium RIFCSPLOWO2_01_FULL_40_28]|uniref:Large ribosomal subunit protein uL18 n=2 Tax=Candidatus Harrisoniibacteriota TaxID=1817905 RepID=A0A1G1ZX66_9BACT|nr:MAG: 50S ribosomal protein L18 [Candidatus Harrisonbacteria bacterium RIFCSPLOWO2_01_FULL_40_28]OGY69061.1 MAG: 50S ribosomal protein L18 [Candidatus Harrisonbacteria bacterium RIFOXYD1_FULL_40_9]
MKQVIYNNIQKMRRARRTRAKLFGTLLRPRLSIFRSNIHTYAQCIDDAEGKTVLSLSTKQLKGEKEKTPIEKAQVLGESLGKQALEKGIKVVVFDRGSYRFHGRVKAVADGVIKAGVKI